MNVSYDPNKVLSYTLRDILDIARTSGHEELVAKQLVGAQLAIQFPDLTEIDPHEYKSRNEPERLADYRINDSVFHVTVAPTPGHYEKCRANIGSGYRAHLLVPDRAVVGARQNAEIIAPASIAVHAIETFIAQNIEELAVFDHGRIISGFRRLLETYNQRVDQVERDKSLLIEIPRNLG
jgi:hypothetical protein